MLSLTCLDSIRVVCSVPLMSVQQLLIAIQELASVKWSIQEHFKATQQFKQGNSVIKKQTNK